MGEMEELDCANMELNYRCSKEDNMRTVKDVRKEWEEKNNTSAKTVFMTALFYSDEYVAHLEQRVLELEEINEILKRNQCEYPQDHDFR